jgi:hypothetical protein
MNDPKQLQSLALGLVGALLGGAIGYFLFIWIAQQNFYALMLPGWLLGEGAGLCARRRRSVPLGVICAVLALLLGIFAEWKYRPFIVDSSFVYALTHVHKFQPITLIFIAFGVFLAYRGGAGRVFRGP